MPVLTRDEKTEELARKIGRLMSKENAQETLEACRKVFRLVDTLKDMEYFESDYWQGIVKKYHDIPYPRNVENLSQILETIIRQKT